MAGVDPDTGPWVWPRQEGGQRRARLGRTEGRGKRLQLLKQGKEQVKEDSSGGNENEQTKRP